MLNAPINCRARYRATCVVHEHNMYLFGGHDGTRHLNDVHVFDFNERTWMMVQTEGPMPIPRDSHVSVVHGASMYVFGGNDFFHQLLTADTWLAKASRRMGLSVTLFWGRRWWLPVGFGLHQQSQGRTSPSPATCLDLT